MSKQCSYNNGFITACHTEYHTLSQRPIHYFTEKPIDFVNHRGLAVLVTCNYEGSPFKVLPGTDEDFTKMKATFEQLGYDVRAHQNSQATVNAVDDLMENISSELKQYSQTTHTCEEKVIVFAFSGYGDEDKIILHDGDFPISEDILKRVLLPNEVVFKIPKLFFINVCQDMEEMKKAMKRVDPIEEKGNYRLDYAIIPDREKYANVKWMVRLAEKLIDPVEGNDSIQNVAAKVKRDIFQTVKDRKLKLPSVDRLDTGPLKLYV